MKRCFGLILLALLLAALGCRSQSASLPAEGSYLIDVTLDGGTGRASIDSPAQLVVFSDGVASLVVVWSSANYDYMLVDDARYEPAIVNGHSTFVIPVKRIDAPLNVVADTTAMNTPHEIAYTITFDAASLRPAS